MFFSPTGATERVIKVCADQLRVSFDSCDVLSYDITVKSKRTECVHFNNDEIFIIGIPVYAGRVPNILLKFLDKISSDNSKCIAFVTYGNRNFDDGLIELCDILTHKGFNVVGAAAIPAEHSFSNKIASGRPDEDDLEKVNDFVKSCIIKINHDEKMISSNIHIEGCKPYRPYYRPKDENGAAVDFKSIRPVTHSMCTSCGLCARGCPMGSIDLEEFTKVEGPCIKCCRCIRICPVSAKEFTDTDFIRHRIELEHDLNVRKEPVFFI